MQMGEKTTEILPHVFILGLFSGLGLDMTWLGLDMGWLGLDMRWLGLD
jgi:hypothetical protein